MTSSMRKVLQGLPPDCPDCCDELIVFDYGYDRGDRSAVRACPACSSHLSADEVKLRERKAHREARQK